MAFIDEIKDKIEEAAGKIKADETIAKRFATDPVSVVEELIGIDLPNDKIDEVVDAIKSKVNIDGILDKLGGAENVIGKLGGLFGKK